MLNNFFKIILFFSQLFLFSCAFIGQVNQQNQLSLYSNHKINIFSPSFLIMFARRFPRFKFPNLRSKLNFKPTFLPLSLTLLTLTYLHHKNKYQLFQQFRANKPEFVTTLSTAKQQAIILIYNRQNQEQLIQKITQIEELCKKNNIAQMILVDQTDIRHLETFTHLIREDIEESQTRSPSSVNLQGKIRILYVHPSFNTMKPFVIDSQKTLSQQIEEIRGFIKINPTYEELKNSFDTFIKTSVLKNCYNDTCVTEYKQKVRQLIESDLLKGKSENYQFFVTTGKNQAKRVSELIEQSTNKQEIYVHYNDILGQKTELFTKWLQKQGNKYSNANQFMMMIRPRVYIIGKQNLMTDVYWYMNSVSVHSTPTLSINNTVFGKNYGDGTNGKQYLEINFPQQQIQKLKQLKQRLGNKVEILILQTTAASELFRHVFMPNRYTIFKMTKNVPYPKLKLQINKDNIDEAVANIESFLKRPKNYSPIVMYGEKEREINAEDLINILEGGRYQRFIFRVCGKKNNCIKSVYQKNGIKLNIPVFKLDAGVQNIGIDQGDYSVENGNISPILLEDNL